MVTYICDLHIDYKIGLMVVSTKSINEAIDIMHMYLISNHLDASYNLKYIKKNIEKLENNSIKVYYDEDD